MCKAKKRLAMLGAVLTLWASLQPLFAGPPPLLDPRGPLDENPWVGITGSTGARAEKPPRQIYNFYLIQLPTGGFYLLRVGLPETKAGAPPVQKTGKAQR